VLVNEVGRGADDVLNELWEGGAVPHRGVVHSPPGHLQRVFHVVADIVPRGRRKV
jgi:hypothetical protein